MIKDIIDQRQNFIAEALFYPKKAKNMIIPVFIYKFHRFILFGVVL
jgi:hypothetical protein